MSNFKLFFGVFCFFWLVVLHDSFSEFILLQRRDDYEWKLQLFFNGL